MNDFDLYLIRLQLKFIFGQTGTCELGPAMTSYDYLEASDLFREMFELNPFEPTST